MKRLSSHVALASLLACSCARSTDPPRTEPTAASRVAEAVREPLSAADAAAQAAERHADAVERAANVGKDPGPITQTQPKPPSAGPELTLEQLHSRMLRLALGSAQGIDDEVEHVAKVMGVPLQPWREGWVTESGRLREGGGYLIEVESANDAEGDKEVLINLYMDDWKRTSFDRSKKSRDCDLPLDPVRKRLLASGYTEWESKPPGPKLWGYNRPPSSKAFASSVTVFVYRVQSSSGTYQDCIDQFRIDIFKAKTDDDGY